MQFDMEFNIIRRLWLLERRQSAEIGICAESAYWIPIADGICAHCTRCLQ